MSLQKPKGKYLSYSAFKLYNECPYKYKLKYIDKLIKFEANIFLAFGSALHTTLEHKIKNIDLDPAPFFIKEFRKELKKIPKEFREENYSSKTMLEFKDQGVKLVNQFMDEFNKHFPEGYDLLSVEEKLFEPIVESDNTNFFGFIDLVVRDRATGKIWIFDHKSCSWGWDARKKSDKMMIYQLSFYKHYFSEKYNIDPDEIETGFILYKRTAKKNQIEFVSVTNGKKRVKNSLNMMYDTIRLIENKVFVKNLLSCKNCYCKKECKFSMEKRKDEKK